MTEKKESAKIISIINMKGGVGKTTLTKEIGYHLAAIDHKKVLLVDADPQANLTQSFFSRFKYKQVDALTPASTTDHGKYELKSASINKLYSNKSGVQPNINDVIVKFPGIDLSLIPGDLNTLFMEINTDSATMGQALVNYLWYTEPTALRDEYDFILIDCPPTYSTYTIAAINASDYYLIPVKPDDYSVLGIKMLNKVVHDIQLRNKSIFRGRLLKSLGIIFTDVTSKPPSGLQTTMDDIRASKDMQNQFFFQNWFLKNNGFFKDLRYFADLSNSSRSKENLTAIVAELMDQLEE